MSTLSAAPGPERPRGTLAEELVRGLGFLLANPGKPVHARTSLNRADMTFSRLDRILRDGRPLPDSWQVERDASGWDQERVTWMYDEVSEALRTLGGAVVSWPALQRAGAYWGRLDSAMRVGSPLPEPWTGRAVVDDLDAHIAAGRLDDIRAGRSRAVPFDEAMREIGLDPELGS